MRLRLLLLVFFIGLCSVQAYDDYGYGYGLGYRRYRGGYEYSGKEDRKCEGGKCDERKCEGDKCDQNKNRCDEYGRCDSYKDDCDEFGRCDDNRNYCDENSKCQFGNCDEYGKCNYYNNKYIYEPCDYPDDVDCVRKFFATYGQCQVVYHEDRKPVYRQRNVQYLPKINLTLITTRVRLSKLDGKIEQFYINKRTGNLVFAVDFKGIEIISKLAIFIVSRRGREPAVAKDMANATYPVTLTAVIPIEKGLTLEALKKSYVTGFLPQPLVRFYIGPRVTESKDPAIQASVLGLLEDVPTAIKEIMLTEAPNFFLAYLQKYICNYGISLNNDPMIQSIFNPNTQVLYESKGEKLN